MAKYDIDNKTPTRKVKRLLKDARCEDRVYVIANLVRVLRHRGCSEICLSPTEQMKLRKALQSVRHGKKVLAKWLPLGYQTARLISLVRLHCNRKVVVTKRDKMRIHRAAAFYRKNIDWHNRRQLRSLILTAQEIGLELK
jgi:hypothetical protein